MAALLAGLLLSAPASAQDKKDIPLDKIPKVVMDGLKVKFPQAAIDKCTKEKEGDIIVYDIEFKQNGKKFEADIKEDGTIHNWEKEIALGDLPAAVKKALNKKYPKVTIKQVMEMTEVKEKKENLTGYEITLDTTDKKDIEVTIAPDGKIMEDSGEKK
jgi:uncharacterized membrane protein YkoI